MTGLPDSTQVTGTAKDQKEQLSLDIPSKIVLDSRRARQDALQSGDELKGREALEKGLEILSSPEVQDDSPSWLSGKIQILGDLERFEEGRKLLPLLSSATRSFGHSQEANIEESDVDDDEMYRKAIDDAQGNLIHSVHVRDWNRAVVAVNELLELDHDYFELEAPMDRFSRCERVLALGLIDENLAANTNPDEAIKLMEKALQAYTRGCFLANLYHQHFDPPYAKITGFDHATCTNLFVSAARVCVYLAEKLYTTTPTDFDCFPRLKAEDWKHQALEFLERGRSRALLDAMVRSEKSGSLEVKSAMEIIIYAARADIEITRRDSNPTSSSERPRSLTPGPQALSESSLNTEEKRANRLKRIRAQ
jgi:hypothetical protein